MEKTKNVIILILVIAVAFFGWILYKDHIQLAAISEDNYLIGEDTGDIAIEEEKIVEEIPAEPEYADNGNVYYYLKSGESLESNPQMVLCYFDDDDGLQLTSKSVNSVMEGLMNSEDYWDEYLEEEKGVKYKYSSSRSTTHKAVFTTSWDGEPYVDPSIQPSVNMMTGQIDYSGFWDNLVVPHYGEHYIGVSEDKGSLIMWDERKDSEEEINKVHYSRVKKVELMPQGVDLDFLYE